MFSGARSFTGSGNFAPMGNRSPRSGKSRTVSRDDTSARWPRGEPRCRASSFTLIVRFTTSDGRATSSMAAAAAPNYGEGDRVTVIYDPASPDPRPHRVVHRSLVAVRRLFCRCRPVRRRAVVLSRRVPPARLRQGLTCYYAESATGSTHDGEFLRQLQGETCLPVRRQVRPSRTSTVASLSSRPLSDRSVSVPSEKSPMAFPELSQGYNGSRVRVTVSRLVKGGGHSLGHEPRQDLLPTVLIPDPVGQQPGQLARPFAEGHVAQSSMMANRACGRCVPCARSRRTGATGPGGRRRPTTGR